MPEVITEWDGLSLDTIKKLIRYIDWAEHHAMRELNVTDLIHKYSWTLEIQALAQVQKDLRALFERRTGGPLSNKSLFQ
jgi:hypothetical protein